MTPGEVADRIAAISRSLPTVAKRAATVSAERTRSALVRISPVNEGTFRAAWRVLTSSWRGNELASVENDAPHAGIIEKGARPHMVSQAGREALRRWVIRKGMVEIQIDKGKNAGKFRKATVREVMEEHDELRSAVDKIVEAICLKLMHHGQKGHFIVEKTLPRAQQWFIKEHERQMSALLGNKAGK